MAGHSKWANIKHRKGAQDAKRGKIFTKLIRELTVAARMGGGGDPASNPRLRAAIDKALGSNMTRDTVDRAIARGVGDTDGDNVEEILYEGYGPSGVAVLVECMSDNRNRTVSEVRHVFSKMGGNLGTDGSVAYLFEKKGQIFVSSSADEEKLIEAALELGADDVQQDSNEFLIVTPWEVISEVKEFLEKKNFEITSSEVTMVPSNSVSLELEQAETFIKMIDMLEDLDDVQSVHSNADISDEILAQLN
jgi:YebC/PmpR family DNA-binding regulatory protein